MDAYHYGFLAFDLERAMDRYEAVFGVEFREPETRQLSPAPGYEDAVPGPIRFSFSLGVALPYLELIEAGESGLFGRQHGEGLHHIGYWVDEMGAAHAERDAAGLATEASFLDSDGAERVFYAVAGAVRVESVNARMRAEYEAGLAAGKRRR